MFQRKGRSHIFRLQPFDELGRLEQRRQVEDLEFSLSANRSQMGSVVPRRRLSWAVGLLLILVMVFMGRSAYLQIGQGDYYRTLAEGNRFRTQRLLPQRGLIYDRRGNLLAQNVPSFQLTMRIADLPTDVEERRRLFVRVAELAGLQPTDLDLLITQYAENSYDTIPIKRHVPYERAMHFAIEAKHLPGFDVQAFALRAYPSTTLSLAHVLGYTGKIAPDELSALREDGYVPIDTIGKIGVERSAETRLRGLPGETIVEVDARGRELSVVSQTQPKPGEDIRLTIDAPLQAFIESRLNNLFAVSGLSRASVVALNPKNGEVLALVSLPGYDPNVFARGIDEETFQTLVKDEDKPLFARAIAGEFPSGSTFKPFVAYAALAERLVSDHTSFVSTGGLRIGEWFFPDWRAGGHGVTDVTMAIADSVNTYFYIVGGGFDTFNGLGVKRITEYAAKFGFGSLTGIDLPGEADGFLPSKEWKEEVKGERWYVGDTYHLAIGQGDFLTTPLQMAVATGIIANDGLRVSPHVMTSGEPQAEQEMSGLDAAAIRVVKRAMRETVRTGSARSLSVLPFSSAGKTGTAQAPGHERFHSWFTGFAPYEDPEIVLAVLVEDGGESTQAAVPLAREILYWWLVTEKGTR